jgi:hypothetical protein
LQLRLWVTACSPLAAIVHRRGFCACGQKVVIHRCNGGQSTVVPLWAVFPLSRMKHDSSACIVYEFPEHGCNHA